MKFQIAQDVQARRFHDELVVLDLVRGEYFAMDEIGSRVWEGLTAGRAVAEVVAAVALAYDADIGVVEVDVAAFAAELVRRHLLVEVVSP